MHLREMIVNRPHRVQDGFLCAGYLLHSPVSARRVGDEKLLPRRVVALSMIHRRPCQGKFPQSLPPAKPRNSKPRQCKSFSGGHCNQDDEGNLPHLENSGHPPLHQSQPLENPRSLPNVLGDGEAQRGFLSQSPEVLGRVFCSTNSNFVPGPHVQDFCFQERRTLSTI
jgi:hypothetical protein